VAGPGSRRQGDARLYFFGLRFSLVAGIARYGRATFGQLDDRSEIRHEHVLAALDRTIANFKRAAELPSDQDAAGDKPETSSPG
jgi:hypothetical protein